MRRKKDGIQNFLGYWEVREDWVGFRVSSYQTKFIISGMNLSRPKNLKFETGRLESALAQLGGDPVVETGMRKSLAENMCTITDVPEDYIKGLDLRQVKVGRGCTKS